MENNGLEIASIIIAVVALVVSCISAYHSGKANKIAEESVYNGYFWILSIISYTFKDIKEYIYNNDMNEESKYMEVQRRFFKFAGNFSKIYNDDFKLPRKEMFFWNKLLTDIEKLKDKFNHYEFEEALEELEQVISELEKRL